MSFSRHVVVYRFGAFLFLFLLLLVGSVHRCLWAMAQEESNESSSSAHRHVVVHHQDEIEDSLFDPIAADPSCTAEDIDGSDCYSPPESSMETETVTEAVTETETLIDATCFKGGDDYSEFDRESDSLSSESDAVCSTTQERVVDKHWGSDPALLAMRDQLRMQALQQPMNDRRPPIFLLPGLASTRLVAWKFKKCTGMFRSDIKVRDNVWLNINLIIQMGTVNVECMTECLRLGVNQTDTDDWNVGCKLRPDEGLDAIASLAPGGIGSSLLVGGTNTVYSWLIQWLSENLGYDVTNMIGLPYDWRLSPDKMEARDGFLSLMRRRIEAAVASNGGQPGIVVAHSMGNLVLRYFLDWLRVQMREEAYEEYIARARRREQRRKKAEDQRANHHHQQQQQQQQQQQRDVERRELQQRHVQDLERLQQNVEGNEASSADPPSPPGVNDAESYVIPGWVIAALPGLDNVLGWVASFGQEESHGPGEIDAPDDASIFAKGNGQATPDASSIQPSEEDEMTRSTGDGEDEQRNTQLRELAIEEGDAKWLEWIEQHLWTYIGLSAPLLGAINPLRAVLSGENMGLPISDDVARYMEVSK